MTWDVFILHKAILLGTFELQNLSLNILELRYIFFNSVEKSNEQMNSNLRPLSEYFLQGATVILSPLNVVKG